MGYEGEEKEAGRKGLHPREGLELGCSGEAAPQMCVPVMPEFSRVCG